MTMNIWKPMTKQEQWQLLFPVNPTRSHTESGLFVKRLAVSALSTIACARGMLPPTCFTEFDLFDTRVLHLKDRTGHKLSDFAKSTLDSALDAFDKRYLHRLEMAVHEEGSRAASSRLEAYALDFHYDGGSARVTLQGQHITDKTKTTLEQIQEATHLMLRTAAESARDEPALPDSYELVFRLYYNEDTPPDYTPPDFEGSFESERAPGAMRLLCCVSSGLHTVFLHKCGAAERLRQLSGDVTPASQPSQPSQVIRVRSGLEPFPVRCLCDLPTEADDVINPPLIQCTICNTLQHTTCYGVRVDEVQLVSETHVCAACYTARPGLVCTDPKLAQMGTTAKHRLCLLRSVIEWCSQWHAGSVAAAQFARSFNMGDADSLDLVKVLEVKGILSPIPRDADPITTERVINQEKADIAVNKYFKTRRPRETQELSPSDTLLSQLQICSQESQNNDLIAKVVINPIKAKRLAAANEFLAALPDTEDLNEEEMPLSGSHNPVKVIPNKKHDKETKMRVVGRSKRKPKNDEHDGDWKPKYSKKRARK